MDYLRHLSDLLDLVSALGSCLKSNQDVIMGRISYVRLYYRPYGGCQLTLNLTDGSFLRPMQTDSGNHRKTKMGGLKEQPNTCQFHIERKKRGR